MTTWKTESDVLLDLDTLSGFSNSRLVSHPTSKAFGGSRSLSTINQIERTENATAMELESKYDRIPTGRGQLIQQLSELKGRNRPGELHSQLRKACGKGYSNELIEAEFGFSSKDDSPSTDQSNIFGDVAERTLPPLSTPSSSLDNGIVGQTSTVSDYTEVDSSPAKHNKLFACPPQSFKRRNNVLLNSLFNLQHTQTISSNGNMQHVEDDSSTHKECDTKTKCKNTTISGNQCVISDKNRKSITIADYLPIDGLASSEHSQFGDGTYSNSVVLSDSHSDIHFTKDDFPPLKY